MNVTQQLAKHVRDVHFGVNWTWVNLKDTLADVTWQQAATQMDACNTIASLVYHMNYYLNAVFGVLQGKPLDSKHENSFRHPSIRSQKDWNNLLDKLWQDAEQFASLVEQLPEHKLWETFVEEKYGNYFRNINGVVEHNHYHLGQIVLLKKLIVKDDQ